MKLYLCNETEATLHGELDLGTLSTDEEVLLDKILDFLEEKGALVQDRSLVIAQSARMLVTEDQESYISFRGRL